jgi:2-iminobutanoate/2-iminopropanoate deaminase
MTVRTQIRVPGRPELSHSADAVRSGSLVFVAGILPVDAEGDLVGGDGVVAQARHVFGELERILTAAGGSLAGVAKVNVYLTDVGDRALLKEVRRETFGGRRPASTLVEVSALAVPGAKIEVDAVAVIP